MKNYLLFPRICRPIGFVLLLISVVLFIAMDHYNFVFHFLDTKGKINWSNDNLTDEFDTAGIIVSLFMIAFSKLKREDEYVSHIRLRSLMIGVYTNYAIFIALTFCVYGLNYLAVILYNVLTTLILFILVFNFNLYIKPRLLKI